MDVSTIKQVYSSTIILIRNKAIKNSHFLFYNKFKFFLLYPLNFSLHHLIDPSNLLHIYNIDYLNDLLGSGSDVKSVS